MFVTRAKQENRSTFPFDEKIPRNFVTLSDSCLSKGNVVIQFYAIFIMI